MPNAVHVKGIPSELRPSPEGKEDAPDLAFNSLIVSTSVAE